MVVGNQSITKDITDGVLGLEGNWVGGRCVQENARGKELIPKILRQTITLSTHNKQ